MEKRNVYVVRCKPHHMDKEADFLKGRLSIGWPGHGDLTRKTRAGIEQIFRNSYPEFSQLELTQVANFVNIPQGSYVLTPSIKTREIHIFKTISEYEYVKELDYDDRENGKGNPHQIRCTLIGTHNREEFDEYTQRALKAAKKTVSLFNKHIDDIERVVNGDELGERYETINYAEAAKETLLDLLSSNSEEIKYKAAVALLEYK